MRISTRSIGVAALAAAVVGVSGCSGGGGSSSPGSPQSHHGSTSQSAAAGLTPKGTGDPFADARTAASHMPMTAAGLAAAIVANDPSGFQG